MFLCLISLGSIKRTNFILELILIDSVLILNSTSYVDCQYALGMQTGAILNGQVSASSEWDWNLAAHFGRLHYIPPIGNTGSWSARTNDANQWLQVNLRIYSRVTRVASQGRHSVSQWVTKYKLQYGDDGTNFQYYIEEGGTAAKVK